MGPAAGGPRPAAGGTGAGDAGPGEGRPPAIPRPVAEVPPPIVVPPVVLVSAGAAQDLPVTARALLPVAAVVVHPARRRRTVVARAGEPSPEALGAPADRFVRLPVEYERGRGAAHPFGHLTAAQAADRHGRLLRLAPPEMRVHSRRRVSSAGMSRALQAEGRRDGRGDGGGGDPPGAAATAPTRTRPGRRGRGAAGGSSPASATSRCRWPGSGSGRPGPRSRRGRRRSD